MKSTKTSLLIKTALCFIGCILLLSSPSQGCFIVGDLDGNCRIDIDDLLLMASQWMDPLSCGSETGLILHWKLDETSGFTATDSSGLGLYDGNVEGARAWNPIGGMLGGALQFDGDGDYVWISQNTSIGQPGIAGSNPRTCAAWIKTDQPSGEIITWGDIDVDTKGWIVWVDETGVLRVDVGGGHLVGTTVLTDDFWHHIAVTSSGSSTDQVALYVDGKIETISEVVSQFIDTEEAGLVQLGVRMFEWPLKGNYFSGLIDDARIYDRALSLQEVWSIAKTATTDYACADMNMDQTVNLIDMAKMSQNWDDISPPITINEFLADNDSEIPLKPSEILDGNGESSDWIEIHNNSELVIDIGNWYLTDDADLKTKWQFPASTVLQPGDYLLVFASTKTLAENPANYPYVDPAGYLHSNFQLSKSGEYLGLIDDDGTTPMHEYDHFDLGDEYGYPTQEENISYGFYYDEAGYFTAPTPGADNIRSAFEEYEFVAKPDVNFEGGCYETAFDVTLSCDTEGAFIRYTTDETVPSLTNGLDYAITGPINVDGLTTIIAKAFKPGLQISDTRIETYIFVDPAVAPFNSNLPIVIVDTLGEVIPDLPDDNTDARYVDCRVVIVDTDEVTGRAIVTGPEHFTGWGMIRRRGESTYNSNHYALEIQDEYREDKDVSLLGMPAESDWIFTWDVIDYTMMKNGTAFKWFEDMGHYAPRQRYVEAYLNTDGGVISSADYLGLFIFREKIKRSKNRVDIARLDASLNLEPEVSGGYIVKCDKVNVGDVLLADGPLGIVDPDYLEWEPYGIAVTGGGKPILAEPDYPEVTQPQIDWIAGYINETSSVLWQNDSSSFYPGPEAEYTDYIDVESWIDRGFIEQICADADAFWGSYYTYKDRGGKICAGPAWDFDRAFHNNATTYNQSYIIWKTNGAIFGKWHEKLEEDAEYSLTLADRWFEHREDAINTAQTLAHIDETVTLITEARSRPKKYYPISFTEEVTLFKDWITNRLDFLDGEIVTRFAAKPPIFTPVGGYVSQGGTLDITMPVGASGDIYYTVNGEDPRLEGGAVNPNASIYSDTGGTTLTDSPVEMSSSVWKYLYDGSDQGTAWRTYAFDDDSWGSGPGQLGFGDDDEATDIGPKVTGYRTAYFRHKFTVSGVSGITDMSIDLLYDDGAVVYINDQEVDRIYMPTGTIYYDTVSDGSGGDNATTVFAAIDPSILVEGDNILAVEVHQDKDNSSDISFDLGMEITITISASSQIDFDKSKCVKARIIDGGDWSAMNTEVYAVGPVLENL
ncbi:MAG: CotH kinase family protein, partial [Planctomycetes bacterium]|nr:CotH kinase family protein [Planctomycetota bacterium]